MLAAAGLKVSDSGKLTDLLLVLLEPVGWFTVWFGLEQVFYAANSKKEDLDFYKKMSNCEIKFTQY